MLCLISFPVQAKKDAIPTPIRGDPTIREAAFSEWAAVSPAPEAAGRARPTVTSRILIRDSSMASRITPIQRSLRDSPISRLSRIRIIQLPRQALLSAPAAELQFPPVPNSAYPAELKWQPPLSVPTAENRFRPEPDSVRNAVLPPDSDPLTPSRRL